MGGRWKEAGLDCLDWEPGSCRVSASQPGPDQVEVSERVLAPRLAHRLASLPSAAYPAQASVCQGSLQSRCWELLRRLSPSSLRA